MTDTKKATTSVVLERDEERKTLLELESVTELFNTLTVTVHRGERVTTRVADGEDDKVTRSKGFIVSNERAEGFGAKIETAIAAFLKALNYGTTEDFAFDVDAEFFKDAPKENVDKDDPFLRDDAEKLRSMRETVNEEALAAEEDEGSAQLHWLRTSQIIASAFEILRTPKRVTRWALGEGSGEGKVQGNAPWLEKLGGSVNALREATFMANLNDRQFDHLAATINRGKAIELEIRKGAEDWIAGAADGAASVNEWMEDEETDIMAPAMLRGAIFGAADAVGVAEQYDTVEGALLGIKAVSDAKVDTIAKMGITKNDTGDDERAMLREVVAIEALIQWVEEAIAGIEQLIAAENNTDESTYKKGVEKAMRAYRGTFYKKVMNAMAKSDNAQANEKRRASAEKAAEGAEAFQGAKKAMAECSAEELAARLWASMKDHKSYASVYERLGFMVAAQKKRDAAADKAKEAA